MELNYEIVVMSVRHACFVQIYEDLEGYVNFLAQTGPFSIPLKCTTKKCDVRINLF